MNQTPEPTIINPLEVLSDFSADSPKTEAASFVPAILDGAAFSSIAIEPREKFMGTWFREGDLGFVFGQRGQGKTWFTLGLALSLAGGRQFGPWAVPKARRVLYVDGEMPMDDLRARAVAMGGLPSNLFTLSHDQCFARMNMQMNLADPIHQQMLIQAIRRLGIEVVVFDNLSCLFGGVRENDADDWEKVLPWLFTLRRMRVAIIVMHHANRGGHEMRGTSRREDAAFWVIKLVKDEATIGDKRTRFATEFTKNRQGDREDVESLLWTLNSSGDEGGLRLDHEVMGKVESLVRLVREGVTSNQDLAKELGVSPATITRIAKEAMQQGRIRKEGNRYLFVS